MFTASEVEIVKALLEDEVSKVTVQADMMPDDILERYLYRLNSVKGKLLLMCGGRDFGYSDALGENFPETVAVENYG